ncbi:hypothetical protein [Bacteriovorax sp. Seq25_V]|uniref:hypothetical protein n=1 Tax=Bacteriovorax sp. Seq25_V TaxID=1201288 RepID=UPI00038A13F6|nr:hypothetical protein [Bacteriovorax sp. Seq25_V]EQC44183.1 hypothetical protein M900_A0340 [Bacteriovorax sp. Seq25_V]
MKVILIFLVIYSLSYAQDDSFEQYRKIRQEMFEKLLKDDNDKFDNTALEILKKLQNSGMQIPENVFSYHKLDFSWEDNKLLIFPVNENDKIEMNIKNGVVAINGLSSKSRKKIKQSIPIIQKYLNYKNTKADFKDEKLIITFIN